MNRFTRLYRCTVRIPLRIEKPSGDMPSEHPLRLRGEADIRDEEDEERDPSKRTTGWSSDTIAVEDDVDME
jgi:hypothetical protein